MMSGGADRIFARMYIRSDKIMGSDMFKSVFESVLVGVLPYWPWALGAGLVILARVVLRSPGVKGKVGEWRRETDERHVGYVEGKGKF